MDRLQRFVNSFISGMTFGAFTFGSVFTLLYVTGIISLGPRFNNEIQFVNDWIARITLAQI